MTYRCYVVFDFDGTLCLHDEQSRLNEIGVCILARLRDLGARVLIVTGRPAYQRGLVTRLLKELGLGSLSVICKTERVTEVEWKRRVAERLLEEAAARGASLCEYHDDNPEVLEAVASLDESVCLIDYSTGYPQVVRRTETCLSLGALEECARASYASF